MPDAHAILAAGGAVDSPGPAARSRRRRAPSAREQHEPDDAAGERDRRGHPPAALIRRQHLRRRVRRAEHRDQHGDADREPDLAQHVDDRRAGRERVGGSEAAPVAINVGSVRPTPMPVSSIPPSMSPT